MASIKAQIDILLTGQRNVNNLLGQLNEVSAAVTEVETKWKVASAALQRTQIRLGVRGTQPPRGEKGRFTQDPDRQARLNALADRRAAVERLSRARAELTYETRNSILRGNAIRAQIEGNEKILRQTEGRITLQQRLNSAVELFETRQQKLARGGGGRGLSQELQEQAREIQTAFQAAGGGASRNLALINSLATGLGRIVERQNEFNRLQALGGKGFETGRRLQERLDAVAERKLISSQRIDRLRRGAARVIATAESGDQQAYSEAVRAATAAVSRAERDSKKLARDRVRSAAAQTKTLTENEKLSSAAVALDKQRQSALEKIFQVEEKIRSSKRISAKEAQDYYFQAQLPRTALPFGDVNQPAMRGGARRGGVSREILGGGRSANEAEAAFRLVEEKSKKTAKVVKESFADAYKAALPPDALSGLTALEKVGKTLTSMKGGGAAEQEKQRKEMDALRRALSAMEGRKYDPLGISDKQINAGLDERASQLQRILQIEEKIKSSRRISTKEAQEYYSRTQLPRLALPFGDVNQPAIRGGARQGGSAREFLGGGRSAEDAERTFRLIEEKASKTGQAIKESFADAYKAMLPPDTVLTGLAALGKVGQTLASMKVRGGGQSGLEQAIGSLQEARGARERFFGGASPAEAIDQIVREFNTGKPAVTEAAGNITQSFSSGLKKGTASSAAAAKAFATAAAQAIKNVFGIKSPSRFMIELVQNLVNTYIAEMQKSYPRIEAATERAFGQETLLRDVKKLTATSKGFEFTGSTSTGFRPLAMGAGTEGASGEFQEMMSRFRKDIAGLTTQPEIYQNLLNALPDSRITTDLAGAANRRALASEQLPSFMSTQRMLGPGELEKTISRAAADYFQAVRGPDPWIQATKRYKEFVFEIQAQSQQLSAVARQIRSADIWGGLFSTAKDAVRDFAAGAAGVKALPPAKGVRIAGALPPALFESGLSPAQELRRQAAYRRSEERSAAVLGGGTTQGLALPPAAQRGLQDAISDLFSRVSNAVRGAFGGPGGPRPPAGGGPGGGFYSDPGDLARRATEAAQQGPEALLGLKELAAPAKVSTKELEALSAILKEFRSVLDPTVEGFDQLNKRLRKTTANIDRQIERRAPDADFLTRQFGPRTGSAISEGLIGGAFPLLFGQGVGASVGGLVGGAGGGFLGGGLGFGLSLVGTAVGTAFDTLNQAAQDTGKALNYPIEGFEALKAAGLLASREQGYYISKLIETGQTSKATAEIQAEMIKKIGVSGVNDLAELGESSTRLSKAWAEFNLQLQAALAGPMAGLLEWVASILELSNRGRRDEAGRRDLFMGLSDADKIAVNKKISEEIRSRGGADALGVEGVQDIRTSVLNEFKGRSTPVKAKEGKLTPEQEEANLNKAIEMADKARSLVQQGVALERSGVELRLSVEDTVYGLRKRATDMEREAIEFRRSVEDQIFGKRQELEQKLIENERKRQQNAIETFDLQLQKASTGLDPITQGVVDAARDYLRIRAEGEADLQQAEKQFKLELQQIDQEVNRYKLQVEDRVSQMAIQRDEFSRDVSRARLQIENQIADRVVQVEEYRLAMAKHRYELEIDLEKKKQIVAQEGLAVQATGGYTGVKVDGYPITSHPGMRRHPITGEMREHKGVDVAAPIGTALGYEIGGEILSAGWIRGYGNTLKVKLENGLTVLSAHLDEIFVTAGQKFQANQRLATVGSTGNSTGPHTHQESWMNGKADPYASLPFLQLGKAVSGKPGAGSDPDIYLQPGVGYFSRRTGLMVRGLTGGAGQAASAGASAQVASGAVGATPALQAAPAMPDLPGAPQLIGINDLMQQYLEIIEKIKSATKDTNALQVQSNATAAERARLTMQEQAMSPIRQAEQLTRELYEEIEARKLRNRLALDGVAPEIIEGKVRILGLERDIAKGVKGFDIVLSELIGTTYDNTTATYDSALAKLKELEALSVLTPAQAALRTELEGILKARQGIIETGEGAIQGAADVAQASVPEYGDKIRSFIATTQTELQDLEQVAINVSQGIGNAVGNSLSSGISGLIEGTTTAKEVFAGFLRDVGQLLVQEGTKMIATYITIAIAKSFAGLGGGGLGFGGASDPLGAGGAFWKNANGNAFTGSGVVPFAKGGTFTNSIVSSPTLFKFANGGTTEMGEMGEAGPEAIMPLSRGRGGRLGVDASGLREAMGRPPGGATGSPVLSLSFQSTTINGVEYVNRDQLEQAMVATRRQAAKEGANRGMSMTLDKLQQSPSTRSRLGIGGR